MKSKIKVLFVASEMAPLAKVGGLGDVIGSLPGALKKNGVEAEVIIPRYEHISKKNLKPFYELDKRTKVFCTQSRGVKVFLIDNKKYLSRGPVYFERTAFAGGKREIDRFLFFSKAVFKLIQRGILMSDMVHANDWHSGALITMLRNQKQKIKNKKLKTIFTIHNLANQGIWRGRNLMREGITNADFVTTVSPTYAKEILTKEYGDGLERLLKKRAKEKKLVGILNGIDYGFWPKPPRGHSRKNVRPRFGFVARLTYQKGLSILLPLVSYFVKKYDAEFYFLGQGEARFEGALLRLAEKYPKNVFVKMGFDEKLARWIYASSDFFLMPSIFEPSGLGQMIAMRYGTIPIVRATGGLKDTVIHKKTGFVFQKINSADLKQAMGLSLAYYFKKPALLRKIISNCRKQDFSWTRSAAKYKRLYANLMV